MERKQLTRAAIRLRRDDNTMQTAELISFILYRSMLVNLLTHFSFFLLFSSPRKSKKYRKKFVVYFHALSVLCVTKRYDM